jgi:DNA polymerase V
MFALVDCNNFYVSCERVFNLSLHNRPVAVLSNNDGCVISRSNELKALGVKMGVPYFQLKNYIKRHNIAICSSNYELYGDMSRRVMSILSEFTPSVEPYSIDEAFLNLSLPDNFDYFSLGQKIRQKILKYTGLPVGVGLASTRTLTKIANHIGKKSPDGVFVMPDEPSLILNQLPVGEVWGIGRRLTEKLKRIGIHTAGQLSAREDGFLRKQFNVCVARTAIELRGTPALESDNINEPSKSVSCSRSFGHPVIELSELKEAIASYTATASAKMRGENQKASGANVYFEYYPEYNGIKSEGGVSGTSVTFDRSTGNTGEMLNKINPVLSSLFIPGRRYKKAGVVFFGLEETRTEQPDLFDAQISERSEKLYAVVDKINKQFGRKAIFNLGEGIKQSWNMKRDHLSPNYTTNWDQIPLVK